ncbi:MAG: hypothetical protein QHJ74_17580, partial [Anaerolineae bacterium]|nr:hypothetical protein [Anaerolineae bacterium]
MKSHPLADYYDLYDQVVAELCCSNLRHERSRWYREQFQGCHVAILPGQISSAILELQSWGVPIVFITAPLSRVAREVAHYDFEGCGVVVDTAEEAVQATHRLLADE